MIPTVICDGTDKGADRPHRNCSHASIHLISRCCVTNRLHRLLNVFCKIHRHFLFSVVHIAPWSRILSRSSAAVARLVSRRVAGPRCGSTRIHAPP
ncbi:hypothetical protein DP44_5667 [Burkholderia pseudomallei]|nr:hypothetical protein DP44_5667 [Burkholderia pseudomallei]